LLHNPALQRTSLRGNRIDWTKDRPASKKSVRVQVTVVEEEAEDVRRGDRMAAALGKLAEIGGIGSIADPQEWPLRAIR
jgi:hypothetical protein